MNGSVGSLISYRPISSEAAVQELNGSEYHRKQRVSQYYRELLSRYSIICSVTSENVLQHVFKS